MLKTETTTIQATYVGLTEGDPPSVNLHKLIQRPDGGQKPFSMSIPVSDAHMLARLRSELNPGSLIEAAVETRWGEAGIPKTLSDFSQVSAPQGKELAATK